MHCNLRHGYGPALLIVCRACITELIQVQIVLQ